MRTKTAKTALISVLMSLALVLIALGGLFLTKPQSATAAEETGIIPVADAELMTSKSIKAQNSGGKGVYWDAGPSQMRIFFKAQGVTLKRQSIGGTTNVDLSKILVTNGGTTKTAAEWKADASTKIEWVSQMENAVGGGELYELWICSQNRDWLTAISEITIQKGFQWVVDGTPVEGAVTNRDYTLINGGENGWMSKQVVTGEGLLPCYNQADTEGTYWSTNMLRIFLNAPGLTLSNGTGLDSPGIWTKNQAEISSHIKVNGEEYSKWSSHVGWMAPHVIQNKVGQGVYEFWICTAPGAEHEEWLAGVKTVTLMEGFKWFENDGAVAGAEVKQEFTMYNGAKAGWQRVATSIEAWMPDGIQIPQRGEFDSAQVHVAAIFADGSKEAITNPAAYQVSVNLDEVGEQEVKVTYQGITFTLANKITVQVAAAPTEITLDKTSFTTHQYQLPDLSDTKITVKFEDNSTSEISASEVKLSVENKDELWKVGGKTKLIVSYTLRGTTVQTTADLTVTDPDLTTGLSIRRDSQASALGFMVIGVELKGLNFQLDRNIRHTELMENSHIMDYVEVTAGGVTKTLTEWNKDGKGLYTGVFNSGSFLIHSDTGGFISTIQKVTFKAGFEWVTADGDNWGVDNSAEYVNSNYYFVDNAVLKKDTTVYLGKRGTDDWWYLYAQSISVKYTGASDIAVNGKLDLDKIELTATYGPDDTAKIPVTADMLEYDFGSEGEKTVTVTYQDHTATFTVNVSSSEQLTGIELTTEPEKKAYIYGDLDVDLSGAVIEAVYTKTGGETRKESVELTDPNIKISGYDPYHLGEQTVTIEYYNFTASFKITMAVSEEWGIEFNWQTGTSYETQLKNEGLHIPASVKQYGPSTLKAVLIYGKDTAYNDTFWSKIEINGRPATEWIQDGILEWAGFYGSEFVFTVSSSQHKLVWGTDSSLYQEGVSEIIGTVKLLPGFQWYTSIDGGDYWPPEKNPKHSPDRVYLKAVERAVLAEELYIMNNNGEGWVLPLKENADGTVASDAITLISLPEKTEYTVGDSFLVKGFKVRLTKTDGSTEDYEPRTNQITGDGLTMKLNGTSVFTKAGTITLTFTYYEGATYSFQVTVKESEGDTPTPPPAEHEHTFSDQWTYDENNHWHAATCDDTTEKKDSAAHTFGDDGKCTVCGYERGTTPPPTEEPSKGCGTIALGGSGWGGGIALGILAIGAALVMFLRKKRA